MQTHNELYQAAMRTVQARRQTARVKAEDNKKLVLAAVPGLAQALEDFRLAGIHAAMVGARGGDTQPALEKLRACKEKCNALLQASGRSPDCLEPKFTCPLCQDTGLHDGKTCSCVQKLMRRMRREEIEQSSSLSISKFATLKLEYYPDAKDPATGRNIRQHMKALLEDLHEYAVTFDHDSINLLLIGNAGLGKTHAALAVAGVVLDRGYDVIYLSSAEFFSQLETAHFTSGNNVDEAALMSAACEADLLILDDLGTEMLSSYTLSAFYNLLNTRMSTRRPTIFTSNIMDGTVFEKRYTEKIASRLAGSCEQFVFLGGDIRQIKAREY